MPQVPQGTDPAGHLAQHLDRFFDTNWPFGEPRPRIYYDKRTLTPGPPWCSLHAKSLAGTLF